jgi:hypothetical protein
MEQKSYIQFLMYYAMKIELPLMNYGLLLL